jgi:hypothetical protein
MGRCLWSLGALPELLAWDREGALHAGGGRPTDVYAAFCGELRVDWLFCRPADPEAKGIVERLQGYLERASSRAGCSRTSSTTSSSSTAGANARTHKTLALSNQRGDRDVARDVRTRVGDELLGPVDHPPALLEPGLGLRAPRAHLGLGEVPHSALQQALLVGETEVHGLAHPVHDSARVAPTDLAQLVRKATQQQHTPPRRPRHSSTASAFWSVTTAAMRCKLLPPAELRTLDARPPSDSG